MSRSWKRICSANENRSKKRKYLRKEIRKNIYAESTMNDGRTLIIIKTVKLHSKEKVRKKKRKKERKKERKKDRTKNYNVFSLRCKHFWKWHISKMEKGMGGILKIFSGKKIVQQNEKAKKPDTIGQIKRRKSWKQKTWNHRFCKFGFVISYCWDYFRFGADLKLWNQFLLKNFSIKWFISSPTSSLFSFKIFDTLLIIRYSLKSDNNRQQKSATIENLQPKICNHQNPEGAMTNSRKENGRVKVCDWTEHRTTPGREARRLGDLGWGLWWLRIPVADSYQVLFNPL